MHHSLKLAKTPEVAKEVSLDGADDGEDEGDAREEHDGARQEFRSTAENPDLSSEVRLSRDGKATRYRCAYREGPVVGREGEQVRSRAEGQSRFPVRQPKAR